MQENLTLLPTIFQERVYKQGCVIPKKRRSKTHEVSPMEEWPTTQEQLRNNANRLLSFR